MRSYDISLLGLCQWKIHQLKKKIKVFILNAILENPPSFNHFVPVLKKGSRQDESPNYVGVATSCPDLSNIEVTHLIPLRDVDILSHLMETPKISELPLRNKGNRRFIIGPHFLC